MKVGLSFDIEDFGSSHENGKTDADKAPPSQGFYHEFIMLLGFLRAKEIKCTLFFVGAMVRHIPQLIKLAHEDGHEIAIHGFRHQKINADTIKEVKDNLEHVVRFIENITSKQVFGFRAPFFSVSDDQRVKLREILNDLGFAYNASNLSCVDQRPFVVNTQQGIYDMPISNYKILFFSVILGGGYFRILPYAMFKSLLQRCLLKSCCATVYLHNYELFSQQVPTSLFANNRWLMALRIWLIAKTSGPLIKKKFERLLGDFDFVPLERLLPTAEGSGRQSVDLCCAEDLSMVQVPKNLL